jgi:hypothetical protein
LLHGLHRRLLAADLLLGAGLLLTAALGLAPATALAAALLTTPGRLAAATHSTPATTPATTAAPALGHRLVGTGAEHGPRGHEGREQTFPGNHETPR